MRLHKESLPWTGTGEDILEDNGSVSSLTSLESNHKESETQYSAADNDNSEEMDEVATDEDITGEDSQPTQACGAERFAGLDQSLFDLDDGDEDDEEYRALEEDSEDDDEDADGDDDSDMYM